MAVKTDDLVKKFMGLDTTCISDALDRLGIRGGCYGITPRVLGVKAVGRAYTVRYRPCGVEKGTVGDFLDDVEPGQVIVLDNGIYEVTGGQKTAAAVGHFDFAALARASGFESVVAFNDLPAWRDGARAALSMPGPRFILLCVEPVGAEYFLDAPGPMSERLPKFQAALAAVGLAGLEQRSVQTLSGGERQRLAIATLLAQRPLLYLLDEPTTHLDLNHQLAMLNLVSRYAADGGAGFVMVLHDVNLALRYCQRALLLYGDGRWQEGPMAQVIHADALSELYQHPLRELRDGESRLFLPT